MPGKSVLTAYSLCRRRWDHTGEGGGESARPGNEKERLMSFRRGGAAVDTGSRRLRGLHLARPGCSMCAYMRARGLA